MPKHSSLSIEATATSSIVSAPNATDPVEAEDAVQDVFVRVFNKIHTFRGRSGFSSWLYRVTTNSVLMRFRKNKHEHKWIPLESVEAKTGDFLLRNQHPGLKSERLVRSDRPAVGHRCVAKRYKSALVLHDIQGYDHTEIAEMSGHSIGNSKVPSCTKLARCESSLAVFPRRKIRKI